ncbi:unnamed protein product [Tilletia caries]|nr:unnamed protein product [Tilletia caries]
MVANGSSAEASGVRAAPMGTASTMSPSQRRIQRDDHQQEQEQEAPPPPSSTPNSSNSPYADRISNGIQLLVALLGALAEVVYDTLAAGLLCLPYSVHLEGWSGGNPTLALIVVHWAATATATATAAVGKVDRPDAGSDDEDLDLLEEEDEEQEGEGVETGARIPRGWGISASDWTSCGRDVFEGSGSSRRKHTTVMLASVPSSPYLRSTSTTTPSSPRFSAAGSVPSTPTGTGRHGHGHRGSGAVVELDWSGASASGSPRIRPSGWSSGRTMSYGGGAAAASGSGSTGGGAPAMGRRRSSGSGSYGGLGFGLGLGLGGAASLPGTPAAGAGGVLSSPFFGAIRTSSFSSSSSRPANGAANAGLGLTALTLRENEEEEDDDGPDQERERECDRDRNRARSTSVSSLASVPELSLGAAAVSLSHGVSTPGGGGGSDALFVESSFSSQRARGRSRLGLMLGQRRPGRLRLRSQPQSRVRLRLLQEGHRRRQRGRPVRMYRFAVTYAAMLHYLATALALRALLDEIRDRRSDRGGLVKAMQTRDAGGVVWLPALLLLLALLFPLSIAASALAIRILVLDYPAAGAGRAAATFLAFDGLFTVCVLLVLLVLLTRSQRAGAALKAGCLALLAALWLAGCVLAQLRLLPTGGVTSDAPVDGRLARAAQATAWTSFALVCIALGAMMLSALRTSSVHEEGTRIRKEDVEAEASSMDRAQPNQTHPDAGAVEKENKDGGGEMHDSTTRLDDDHYHPSSAVFPVRGLVFHPEHLHSLPAETAGPD